ncbi:fungal-specific transcription factor domain-containing protein [Boeremia exigua]|uniref:fungal-specific transcription factor domain-containing protein n=1 Tax=Boeremia exigua TaxID=749465 RepID=UPI001E8ECF01|nr:fungal-specific transcription factor domain-containing protein [Boeremia exigua]KAH6642160.1 fungal-specific transcription factor domain-containing protein [Boeremia exigua]
MPAAMASTAAPAAARKTGAPEKKYKCQFCNRAFSRSEHRSRHERSHTKERPFKCLKCRSTFVRRDLLLRHDRTVHAKDGGAPLPSEQKRRASNKALDAAAPAPKSALPLDAPPLDQLDASEDGMVDVDIETAAMLMTDFHHKAMASQEPEMVLDHADPVISPAGPQHMEPSAAQVPYTAPGQNMLPQMPWRDSMVPQSEPEPQQKTHSSFHPHSHLAPMMERTMSGNTALAPTFPSMSENNLGTPNPLSPYPSMLGPVSPVDYRKSPGPSQALTMTSAPQLESEEQCRKVYDNIKQYDSENALLDTFHLPSLNTLNRLLKTYFDLFHHHLPFLHPATFHPTEVAAPLLLAVLSIGALYIFDQDQAYMLHIGSKVLVNQFLQNKENFSSRKCPLWTMQSTLLNMQFSSWSGDPKGLEWACSIKSLLANMVAGNRYELKIRSEAREGAQPSHQEWIEDEQCRRTYYAVYIFFGLLTLTYNHTPAMGFNEFDTLELPSSESLWTMSGEDEEAWREALAVSKIITFRQAHDNLFQGETARYSAFATRVMINALFLEVWYHKRSPEALQDVVTEYKLRLALETWEKSLDLCEPETVVVRLSAPHKGHPLIFNAMALYRNTRARLVVDLKSIQEALRYHDSYEVAAAMTNARDKVQRSQEMIKVIQECFDCIEVAAVQGIRWVARTSATNWSIEHPLAGMDLVVILTLWLYRLEHDEEPANEEELAMYNKLRNLFDDDSVDVYGAKLSSTVARLWGSMIDEVVVWGITKLMGEAFKLHSQALVGYEDAMSSRSGSASPLASGAVQVLEMQMAY